MVIPEEIFLAWKRVSLVCLEKGQKKSQCDFFFLSSRSYPKEGVKGPTEVRDPVEVGISLSS